MSSAETDAPGIITGPKAKAILKWFFFVFSAFAASVIQLYPPVLRL
jgi:hypothetical protein